MPSLNGIRCCWTNCQYRRLGLLKSVFSDPERLLPNKTRAALTAQAAAEFAELAGRLRDRSNNSVLEKPLYDENRPKK